MAGLLQLPQGRRPGDAGGDDGNNAREIAGGGVLLVQDQERLLRLPRLQGRRQTGRLLRPHEHRHQGQARNHPPKR
jgi:hypothetical protein